MSDIFDDIFGERGGRRGRRRGRAAAAASAAPICATTWRSGSRRPIPARPPQIRVPTSIACEACSGTGAKAGLQAEGLPHLRRPRPRARRPGLLLDRADLPDLPGPRRDHRRPLQELRRRRPRDAGAHAVGQHSGRRRGRHPHPARRRGRGRLARRPGGRPLHLPVDRSRTRSSSATAPTSFAACRSRWRRRRSAAQFEVPTLDGSRPRVKIPEGTQTGKQFRLKGKGMPVLRSAQMGDHVHPGHGRDAEQADARQRELLEEVRAGLLRARTTSNRPASSRGSAISSAAPEDPDCHRIALNAAAKLLPAPVRLEYRPQSCTRGRHVVDREAQAEGHGGG